VSPPLFIKSGEYCPESIGSGTFGKVYKCLGSTPQAVVKVARTNIDGAVASLEREIKFYARHSLNIDCLPAFFGDGTFNYSYRCMKIEELVPLSQYIAQCRTKDCEDKALSRLLCEGVSGLDAIHHVRTAHLDLKVNNVMVRLGTPDRVVLVDFGMSFTKSISSSELGSLWTSGARLRRADYYFANPPFSSAVCDPAICHALMNTKFISGIFADFFLLSVLVLEVAMNVGMNEKWFTPDHDGKRLGDKWIGENNRSRKKVPWLSFVITHDEDTCSSKLLHKGLCVPARKALFVVGSQQDFRKADNTLTQRILHEACYAVPKHTLRADKELRKLNGLLKSKPN
jgi:serine/threonine protein kinase